MTSHLRQSDSDPYDNAPIEVQEAVSMMRCPYYQREDTCTNGCYSEPRCITCAPPGGWEAVVDAWEEVDA